MIRPPPRSTLFPYTPPFRSDNRHLPLPCRRDQPLQNRKGVPGVLARRLPPALDGFQHRLPSIATKGIVDVNDKRSEEHTSELQSHLNLVCRLLLEKKKTSTL